MINYWPTENSSKKGVTNFPPWFILNINYGLHRFFSKVMFKECNQQIVLAGFAFLKKKVLGRNAFVLPSKVFLRVVCK